ncbi:ABC transporter permease subunit [Thiohalocapsa marina]|uniref:ABC transporter permease subunit n=1 Tax=Thiohalocapsa marina TaxID=424902 RepID=A0A5M8FGN6_9GAMM|nr:glycine betaine ABC transporter substrate-binding protein [Thiohalocapsa marina]KAA6182231.1 ABC transporter permease subunit [Thiohalocapsa marina]
MLAGCSGQGDAHSEIRIGSKKFTEGVILGEVLTGLATAQGLEATHKAALGGSRILYNALRRGEIDAYVEYSGTLMHEIFAGESEAAFEEEGVQGARESGSPMLPPILIQRLAADGIRIAGVLGFENNYALGMPRERAHALGIARISDLLDHPRLRLRFGSEFLERADGWPGLAAAYRLPQTDVLGMEHELAYRALATGAADLTDVYTTDAEIAHYDLVPLQDDQGYFRRYQALVLFRLDLPERVPGSLDAFDPLIGHLDAPRMIQMNADVKLGGQTEAEVAAGFLRDRLDLDIAVRAETLWDRLLRTTLEHLVLVGVSLSGAILVAVPLGMLAAYRQRLGQGVLAMVGIAQTIPALALLVFMIPFFGIGAAPAIAALFLYSLLPIVRNTHAGITGLSPPLVESALALGLPTRTRLWRIELPLALPMILAGIKTAAVINVGGATLGALIGAGGYGQPILTGIRLDDLGLILEGAIPAAVLALLTQWGFERIEARLLPRGLQSRDG